MAVDEFVWVIEADEDWQHKGAIQGVYATEEAARSALEKRADVQAFFTNRLITRPANGNAYPRMYANRYRVER